MRLLVFLLSQKSSRYIQGTRLSPDLCLARILSRSVGRLPFLGGGVGSTQKVSVLAEPN